MYSIRGLVVSSVLRRAFKHSSLSIGLVLVRPFLSLPAYSRIQRLRGVCLRDSSGVYSGNKSLSHLLQRSFTTSRLLRENTTDINKDSASKTNRRRVRQDAMKLLNLVRPEFKLLLGALGCLTISSTVSMSLPLVIGKILDLVGKDTFSGGSNRANETIQSALSNFNWEIYGLDQTSFYAALGIFFLVGSTANFGRIYLLRSVGEKLVARLRSRLFLKILAQDAYFFDTGPTGGQGIKTGDLISRITSDTQIISKTLSGNISDGARAMINGVVGLSMMYFVSWKMTLCMSVIFPPLILMSFFYGRIIKTLARKIQDNLGELTKYTEENLNGIRTIQSFSQQLLVIHGYNAEVKHVFRTSLREGKLSGIFYGINGFIGNSTIIGLLAVGTHFISQGLLTIGDLSSFMMYALYTGSSVFGLGNFYTELMKGIGASERLFELLELKLIIKKSLGQKVHNLEGGIKFENVKFTYPARALSEVLSGFNVTIDKGQNVCFVGPSGSGKSTIAQLLLRFYDPKSGVISINGKNIKDLNVNNYRAKLGYVQQEPMLFSGTVRENIVFGKKGATDEEILEAADLSNARSFIEALPQGLETMVGPSNSTQLSGGQRQRISIARTLIKKPKILILDEATSALDSISEEIVMRNIKRVSETEGITIVSIAHRLSTIQNSDRIIVLNGQGEIVEDGQFSQVYSDKSSQLNRLLQNNH